MKELKPFIMNLAAAAVLFAAGMLIRIDYYRTRLCSMGIGILLSSGIHIVRILYWNRPARAEAYRQKIQAAHINRVDERKQYIRMKSGQIAYQCMTVLLLVLAFIFALVRADVWLTGLMYVLFLASWFVGVPVFHILEKRM